MLQLQHNFFGINLFEIKWSDIGNDVTMGPRCKSFKSPGVMSNTAVNCKCINHSIFAYDAVDTTDTELILVHFQE